MRTKLVFALAFVGVWACSTYGEDEPASPTSGGDAGTTVDGGTDTGAFDAGSDSAPGLTNVFDDVTYDAFDDFERAVIVAGGPFAWEEKQAGTTSPSLTLETCAGAGCSGRVMSSLTKDGNSRFLTTALAETSRIVRFDFAAAVETTGGSDIGEVQLASFEVSGGHYIFVDYRGGIVRLADQLLRKPGQYDTQFAAGPRVSLAAWAAYRLYLNLDRREVALSVNGVETRLELRSEFTAESLRAARLGITYVVDAEFRVRYDNVGLKQSKN